MTEKKTETGHTYFFEYLDLQSKFFEFKELVPNKYFFKQESHKLLELNELLLAFLKFLYTYFLEIRAFYYYP